MWVRDVSATEETGWVKKKAVLLPKQLPYWYVGRITLRKRNVTWHNTNGIFYVTERRVTKKKEYEIVQTNIPTAKKETH